MHVRRIVLLGTESSAFVGFRKDLIQKLISLDYEVILIASSFDCTHKRFLESLGCQTHCHSISRSGSNPMTEIVGLIRLWRLIRKISPSVMLSFFAKPVVYGAIVGFFSRVQHNVGMLEGLGYYFTKSNVPDRLKKVLGRRLMVFLYRVSLPLLDDLILLNRDDEKDLILRYKLPTKRITILGGIGVNVNEYSFVRRFPSQLTFTFVGRFLIEKGFNEFLQSAQRIKIIYPDVRFVVIGKFDNDNPGGINKRFFEELILSNVVETPGFVQDIRPWLASSSVLVLPSYREGVPRSAQEAAAIGRAIITTDVPGCRETVVNGSNGFIVPPFSSAALTTKMKTFIENPDLIERMGFNSRRLALQCFDQEIINTKLISILELG